MKVCYYSNSDKHTKVLFRNYVRDNSGFKDFFHKMNQLLVNFPFLCYQETIGRKFINMNPSKDPYHSFLPYKSNPPVSFPGLQQNTCDSPPFTISHQLWISQTFFSPICFVQVADTSSHSC